MIQVQETEAIPDTRYCNSITAYSRFKTREVPIGGVPVGGGNPIRIQSMTTTDTMDTDGTVKQAIRIIQAGGDYVRITAPSMNEARNLENIKKELRKRGYATPLIADIHFTPNAAEVAARIVEKVRINPGNYADRKKFEQREYTDSEYLSELERIREQVVPLVRICKEYGTAMRIGANHGSLSDRIMNRFGDTPKGMVESALEFVRICEDEGFYNLVLSMKASNPIVMIQAYRLLMNAMILTKRNYPLHIGVTEAGEGVDARVKSAVGIGTLLEDGIGDTIRVSLAEDPEFEIPVAIALAKRYEERKSIQSSAFNAANPEPGTRNSKLLYSPFNYNKRSTHEVKNIGGRHVPVVVADFSRKETVTAESLSDAGYTYSDETKTWKTSDAACDYIYMGKNPLCFIPPSGLGLIYDYEDWKNLKDPTNAFPLFTTDEYLSTNEFSDSLHFLTFSPDCYRVSHFLFRTPPLVEKIKNDRQAVLIIETHEESAMLSLRRIFFELLENDCYAPVVIRRVIPASSSDEFRLYAATDLGGLLANGFGDGVWLAANDGITQKDITETAFSILQATRSRISRTDYVACPSCGRTLFNLQETTQLIKKHTAHLKGVKIAIMGCIVNGPGEMADADYGYVGTGPGKITLYKGKEVVQRNVPAEHAVKSLIDLIKKNGDWVESK